MATDEYAHRIVSIAKDYQRLLNENSIIEENEIRKVNTGINEHLELLQAPKPRIMVYGIYNSGKSTLVNAICGEKKAAVADHPETDKVTPYEQDKYILVDSPGVNAPIEHEQLADKHLQNCHMILFVISSKGTFEDRTNYEKMWNLIRKNIPFYIVLNDRGPEGGLPEDKLERIKALERHEAVLRNIQDKIISNLQRVSGVKNVYERYQVITINAKRAWLGIEKNKPALVEQSHLDVLQRRIKEELKAHGGLNRLLLPVNNLIELMTAEEKYMYAKVGQKEYGEQRERLQRKIQDFKETFMSEIQLIVREHEDRFVRCYLGQSGANSVSSICEAIDQKVQDAYNSIGASLLNVGGDMNFGNSQSGLNRRVTEPLQENQMNYGITENVQQECSYMDDGECAANNTANTEMGNLMEEAAKLIRKNSFPESIIPEIPRIPTSPTKFPWAGVVGGILTTPVGGILIEIGSRLLSELLKDPQKKYDAEAEKMKKQVAQINLQAEQWVQSEAQRRQEARGKAQETEDLLIEQYGKFIREQLTPAFEKELNKIDEAMHHQQSQYMEIDRLLQCRKKLEMIRDEIQYAL